MRQVCADGGILNIRHDLQFSLHRFRERHHCQQRVTHQQWLRQLQPICHRKAFGHVHTGVLGQAIGQSHSVQGKPRFQLADQGDFGPLDNAVYRQSEEQLLFGYGRAGKFQRVFGFEAVQPVTQQAVSKVEGARHRRVGVSLSKMMGR